MENSLPLVSVVVPTYNSAKTLELCLKSIKNQTYKAIELLVVDNNSQDTSKEIAHHYADVVIDFWPERTFQKNEWMRQAQWEYVFFVDSDMELTEKVIENCVKEYQKNSDIGGICIPERSVGKWLFVEIRDFERSFYDNTAVESARFFLLNDVQQVWWFEEDLIFFEESLLPQKIESKLGKSTKFRISDFILHQEGEIKLWKWLAKKFYYGKSLSEYQKKVEALGIKQTADWQIGIVGRYMIFLKNKRFYSQPLLAFGVLLLKTCEFVAGGLGMLFSKLKRS